MLGRKSQSSIQQYNFFDFKFREGGQKTQLYYHLLNKGSLFNSGPKVLLLRWFKRNFSIIFNLPDYILNLKSKTIIQTF